MRPSPSLPPPAVVLHSRDATLADHVRALGEAVGVPVHVSPDPPPAGRPPGLLLVGLDVAGAAPRSGHVGALVVRVEGGDPPDGVWRQALELGARRVALLPEHEPWLLEAMAEAAAPVVRAPVVGVLAGAGGAGASALATALAVTAAARGVRPVLVDADPLGPGLDVSFGSSGVPGLRWEDLPGPGLRLPAGSVSAQLPEVAGVLLLGPGQDAARSAPPHALLPAIEAAEREAEVVVVDLPRPAGDLVRPVLSRCATVLLVVPAAVRGVAAAVRCAAAVVPHAADVRVVVRGPGEPGLAAEDVADALDLPLAGEVGAEPALHAALARGEAAAWRPRRGLEGLCSRLLADVLEPR